MLAARRRRWSLAVHAVDDAGALCDARPVHGRWRPAKRGIVNCVRCLLVVDRGRFSFCEAPALVRSAVHIRRVGLEGVKFTGSFAGVRALCGAPVGWDLKVPIWRQSQMRDSRTCAVCKRQFTSLT